MRDFTIKLFRRLLESLLQQGFFFQTFSQFIEEPKEKAVVLRHDVDKLPENSLVTAKLEHSLGIRGTYYFRAVPCSWDEEIIKQIAALGHEIGYHYESLTTCNGNIERAYEDFRLNLEKLRCIAPVTSICMHGSPRSKWDSKDLWKKYNYKELGLLGEPYFDIDFSRVFYLTDTGRRWDGFRISMRDKIEGHQERWVKEGLVFHSTTNIIDAANENLLPEKIMITVHPQRWTNDTILWFNELLCQRFKNLVKGVIIIKRKFL